MDAKDRTYFLRRVLQEQEAALNAACAEARERHEQLAAAYLSRCRLDAPESDSSDEVAAALALHSHQMAG